MDINQYTNYIAKLADKAKKEANQNKDNREKASTFLNSSNTHASVVMSNIFRTSDDVVKIFAGNLNGAVSEDFRYQTELKNFLHRGGKVQILLTSLKKDVYPELFYVLNDFLSDQVSVKHSINKLTHHDSDNEMHFTIGDSRMIRIEHDVENYLALGSFEYEEIGLWEKYFDFTFAKSTEIINYKLSDTSSNLN